MSIWGVEWEAWVGGKEGGGGGDDREEGGRKSGGYGVSGDTVNEAELTSIYACGK